MKRDWIAEHDFRQFVLTQFRERALARPSYSFRAYAKFLGLDPSTLRKILTGKRTIGEKVISRIGTKLGLSPEELRLYIEANKALRRMVRPVAREFEASHKLLSAEEFARVASWQPYAVLELMDVKGFRPDSAWIARRLRLPKDEADAAISNLFELGWIVAQEDGSWSKAVPHTTTNGSSPEIAALRRQMMEGIAEMCLSSLRRDPREIRTHRGMTFAMDKRKLPEAMERIRAFMMELSAFLNDGKEYDSVYELFVSLYPLTEESLLKSL